MKLDERAVELAVEAMEAHPEWANLSRAEAAVSAYLAALSHPEPVAQEAVDDIVTALYRRFKEWSKREFGPDDVTWCEVKADVEKLVALYAHPSPSPEQGEDDLDRFMELVSEGNFYTDYDQSIDTLGKARRAISALRARVAELEARATPQALDEVDGIRAVEAAINEARRLNHAGVEAAVSVPSVIRAYLFALSTQGSSSND